MGNAGFLALDDVDAVSDAELYGRLPGEFPDWLRAARTAGALAGRPSVNTSARHADRGAKR